MKRTIYSALFAMVSAVCLNAQEEGSHLALQLGAGFTQGLGRTGSYLDTGWNTSIGIGYNFNSNIGALLDISDSSLGINSATLGSIGASGGNVNIFAATVDPIVHLNPHGRLDFYVTGGGGVFHRLQTFNASSVTSGYGFNSYFGVYPAAAPVTQLLASYSVNKPGYDIGIGIALGSKWHGKFFAEARYDRMFDGGYHTDYLPVTFGYRW